MKDHLKEHFSLIKAECNICWKSFTSSKALKAHTRTVHLTVDPHKLCCNICHINCRNLTALKNHKSTHKVPKTCPICFKSIKPRCFPGHIKLHELKKEEKKLECKVCLKKFYTKSSLYSHMRTHNKSLKCDLCDYRTGRKDFMVRHMENKTLKC